MNDLSTRARAELSRGASGGAIHDLVSRCLAPQAQIGTLVDVGCGSGELARRLAGRYERYVGCDIVRYHGFPNGPEASFVEADLDRPPFPIPDQLGTVTCAIETIEHLENPRALARELCRVTRRGGLVIITTPNQLSLLSKLTLVLKNQHNAFQDPCYPAHITPLLEVDLVRIARECGLEAITVAYTDQGRVPLTSRHWPRAFKGRWFSDNMLLMARRS
jgi:SAM-dependent methyltransferase